MSRKATAGRALVATVPIGSWSSYERVRCGQVRQVQPIAIEPGSLIRVPGSHQGSVRCCRVGGLLGLCRRSVHRPGGMVGDLACCRVRRPGRPEQIKGSLICGTSSHRFVVLMRTMGRGSLSSSSRGRAAETYYVRERVLRSRLSGDRWSHLLIVDSGARGACRAPQRSRAALRQPAYRFQPVDVHRLCRYLPHVELTSSARASGRALAGRSPL